MDEGMKTAWIEKADKWDAAALVSHVQWIAHLSGGPFDGRTKITRTRREAREWCDERGYTWKLGQ